MRNLMLLALLAAAASTGLATPWWLLAVAITYALVLGSTRHPAARTTKWGMGKGSPVSWSTGTPRLPSEVRVATIYERSGRLVLRRVKP